jgi:phenylalanine-4-hydroxylase
MRPDFCSTLTTEHGHLPVYPTAPVPYQWQAYTEADHASWRHLVHQQLGHMEHRACEIWWEGWRRLAMDPYRIPDLHELNVRLNDLSNWTLIPVGGLLPDIDAFGHLAERRLGVTHWIRPLTEEGYIAEPDLFHDLFGHVPFLAHRAYADHLQRFGRTFRWAHQENTEMAERWLRLAWHTVEFGLIREEGALRLFGAGLISSAKEAPRALEEEAVQRLPFDLAKVMDTSFRIDRLQETYFILEATEHLYATLKRDDATQTLPA